jgi:hypothetical protein
VSYRIAAGTVIAGRWRLTHELPGSADAWAWACVATDDGTEAECVGLRPGPLLWPGAREGFAAGGAVDHPATLPVLARDVVNGVPVRVRPRTAGPLGRLDAAQGLAVLRWLGGAVLAGGGAAAGNLRGDDVVVDAEGVPRFTPLGVAPPRAVQANPARAPEKDAGGAPDARADLWGLAVLVHAAVSGESPWPAVTQAELEGRRATPRPRVRDDALDAELDGCLRLDPAHRAPPGPAGDAPRVTPGVVASAATTALGRPTPPQAGGLLQQGFPKYVVLVPTHALGPGALARLAIRSGSALPVVQDAARRGEPWAVDGAPVEEDARRLARRLASAGLPAEVQPTKIPRFIHFVGLSALVCAGGFALDLWAMGALLALVCLWVAFTNIRGGAPIFRARQAWQGRLRGIPPEDGALAGILRYRRRVEDANLPEPARVHLVGDADALLRELEDATAEEVELVAAGADAAAARARLAAVPAQLARLEADLARVAHEVRAL